MYNPDEYAKSLLPKKQGVSYTNRTTEKPKGIKYFKCEIIGEHTMSEQEWSDAVTKADLALQEIFGDEFGATWDFDYDIDSYLNS